MSDQSTTTMKWMKCDTERRTEVQYSALHLWARDAMWYCYWGGFQTTFAMPHLHNPSPITPPLPCRPSPQWSTEPVISTLVVVVVGGGRVASQLTWRGSHRDKSQFTQGAVTLDDIFTGCLYSSFDNAPATSFISLKDESKAGNVISPLRQGRRRRRIKEEGGAS